ncbi:ChrR-like anti-ECFsigma factor [Roseibium hamelinense]|uniref:ChrR-like anti-ECFsigma factor n=1 Tax=Roseibium hamelinense TaxID=150831 RepID=A0A562TIL2_9HYPH|nr:ChrR family anti-sigma-E factor [Roseibium hamelinense]MTI46061.1 transcriptional regulator [Roseibium hamelinense]TWI92746.1 ChrR-like anti-ECFsigma factor [Roseibium hamelinense]
MEKNVTGLDELLASYAAGTLASPAQALVDAHLELSNQSRAYVGSLEALAGAGLEDTAPAELSDRDAALAAIFADDEPIVSKSTLTERENPDQRIPKSLRAIIDGSIDDLPWRTLIPGVREVKLGEIDGCNASLLWVRGGKAMPSHTHHGTELTLVIQGGFKDSDGHYVRGDIAFADDSVDHKPIADEGEDCICFAVTEGRLRLTGPVGRFFAPFVG